MLSARCLCEGLARPQWRSIKRLKASIHSINIFRTIEAMNNVQWTEASLESDRDDAVAVIVYIVIHYSWWVCVCRFFFFFFSFREDQRKICKNHEIWLFVHKIITKRHICWNVLVLRASCIWMALSTHEISSLLVSLFFRVQKLLLHLVGMQ